MGIWENIKNIITIPDEDFEEEETELEVEEEENFEQKKAEPRILKSKALNYGKAQPQSAGTRGMQVVLVKPDRFEDAQSIADHLNAGKTVVLNLEEASGEVSRRIVDFLSGAAYANGGNMRKVAKHTFIIVAHGVDVMGELMLDELDESKLYF